MLVFLIPVVIICILTRLMSMSDNIVDGSKGTKLDRWCYRHDGILSFSLFVSIIIFIAMFISLAVNHIGYSPFPSEYKAVTTTLETFRNNDSTSIERAGAVHKIVAINRQIATAKYWNDSVWVGWFIPDRVANLDFIE